MGSHFWRCALDSPRSSGRAETSAFKEETVTKAELCELIAQDESSKVEFEGNRISNHRLARELVAFANVRGGYMLLGVDDDGGVNGLTPDEPTRGDSEKPRTYHKLKERVVALCKAKIRPALVPHFEVIRDVELGRDVAVVSIDRGWTVHHLCHNQDLTCYARVGTISGEASAEELARRLPHRGAFRLELRPVSGTSITDLDRRRLVDYFGRVQGQDVPPNMPSQARREGIQASAKRESGTLRRSLADYPERKWHITKETAWESLLVNTWMLHENGPHSATVAALMLFGKNPDRFLPHAKIDAAAYLGGEKNHNAKERRSLRGPILPLQGADGTLLEPGLVEQAVDFVEPNTKAVQLEDGVRRQRSDYPSEVVREAIVNAIIHRDYSLSDAEIKVSIYADRLEITSLGSLVVGNTLERMKAGCRRTRNELLKDVMRDYGYLEHMRMGVPRKIVRGMKEHKWHRPRLGGEGRTVHGAPVEVAIPSHRPSAPGGERVQHALRRFRGRPCSRVAFRALREHLAAIRPTARHLGRRLGACSAGQAGRGATNHRCRPATAPVRPALPRSESRGLGILRARSETTTPAKSAWSVAGRASNGRSDLWPALRAAET